MTSLGTTEKRTIFPASSPLLHNSSVRSRLPRCCGLFSLPSSISLTYTHGQLIPHHWAMSQCVTSHRTASLRVDPTEHTFCSSLSTLYTMEIEDFLMHFLILFIATSMAWLLQAHHWNCGQMACVKFCRGEKPNGQTSDQSKCVYACPWRHIKNIPGCIRSRPHSFIMTERFDHSCAGLTCFMRQVSESFARHSSNIMYWRVLEVYWNGGRSYSSPTSSDRIFKMQ